MSKILVYGWYHQGNIGDDLFIEAFQYLFPNLEFVFTDQISVKILDDVDAVFLGGGSFLVDFHNITGEAFDIMKQKKIFYIGVGIEDVIHPNHLELMINAKLIATRSLDQIDRIKLINNNTIFIPDLVYSLISKVKFNTRKEKSVLILPNSNVVPSREDPCWKHAAWNYFKSEFSQFLDWLVENKYELEFFSFCQAKEMHDNWATNELISHMVHRNNQHISTVSAKNIGDISHLCSKHTVIITQRFHGVILAEMTRTPYLSLYHHDKLKTCYPSEGKFISYYGLSKRELIDNFNYIMSVKFDPILPIETNIYETLIAQVIDLL